MPSFVFQGGTNWVQIAVLGNRAGGRNCKLHDSWDVASLVYQTVPSTKQVLSTQ